MSRKDYVAIAAVVADPSLHLPDCKRLAIARRLVDVLAADNPRFDRARFIAACMAGEES